MLLDFNKIDKEFLKYYLSSDNIKSQINKEVGIGGGVPKLALHRIENLIVFIPEHLQQKKIASILSSVDVVIEKTEAAIAKYKAIKAGMMHDLFTRGIGENGQLRPAYQDAPHLYKDSKLGWIPKEWEVNELITVAKDNQYSFTGGPFGSDLKTNAGFKAELLNGFRQLAAHPEVATAPQIAL